MRGNERGTSLIDLLISMAIIAILFGGIYMVYFSLLTAIGNVSVRTAAATAVNAEIETIRNLPYDSVGTVGGIPAGVIPQAQAVSAGNFGFILVTTVRNIDDPFDGTVTGNPAPVDTAPADYKLVEIQATCPLCDNFGTVAVTTTVAPKNLESATQNGSLFIYALDASGHPVPGAYVQVTNNTVTPSINLTDTTNASGVLQLVGVPTSTQAYAIAVGKPGYSNDQTYPIGAPSNPNPVKPNATVAAQTVTAITFSIDRTSALTVYTSDNRCGPVGNESFSLAGAKLIGTSPDVLKFSTTTATGATGSLLMANMEWDTYSFVLNDGARDLAGTIPFTPFTINPSSTVDFRFVSQPAADPALLVSAVDAATGAGIGNASVAISRSGFSETLATGHAFVAQSDWSGGQYSAQSGGLDTSAPGKVTLLANASGTYAIGANDWLVSNTFDLGGSSSTLYSIAWSPAAQPDGASASFQIAANNDNVTWNFVGPDGTAGSYFTAMPAALPAALSGNRYVRYKMYLSTADGNVTPEVDSFALEFYADCVPPAQALFTNLAQATYLVDVTAADYVEATTTVSVGAGESAAAVMMTHL